MAAVVSFLSNRRRLIVGIGAAAATGYALVDFAKRRFGELQVKLSHDRAARDKCARTTTGDANGAA